MVVKIMVPFLGYPKYSVPYYDRDPKKDHNFGNHPYIQLLRNWAPNYHIIEVIMGPNSLVVVYVDPLGSLGIHDSRV